MLHCDYRGNDKINKFFERTRRLKQRYVKSYILKNKNSKIYEDYLKQLIWANQNFSNIQMKNGSYNENDIWSRKYFIN